MFWLKASTTQVVPVGPLLDITDGATPEDALSITGILGEMHMQYYAGTAPGLVTFSPTSTATYTLAGAMAALASASGMYSLVLTPTLTGWRGSGKLVLRSSSTMLPYWENVFCATGPVVDSFAGSDYLPVDTVQIDGAAVTATTAHLGVNLVNVQGTAVTATAAMMGVNVVNFDGVAPTATAVFMGVNVVNIDGVAPTATTAFMGVTVVDHLAAALASINAEMVDTLNVDNYGELGAVAPSVSVPLSYKLGFLYKIARNKIETTATAVTVYQDDGATAGQKSTISDDGTTFTRGEFGAP